MWGKRYQGKRWDPEIEGNKGEQTHEESAAHTADTAAKSRRTRGKRVEKKKSGFWRDYGYLLVTAAVVVLVFRVFLQLAYVPTGSMESTIPTNSLLVAWQFPYLVSDPVPQRGDIVTFWSEEQGKILVKRVIGLPGEEIRIAGGYVYVNGHSLPEPYLDQQGVTATGKREVYEVPEGSLLTLGDNRPGSFDSRLWNDPYVPCGNVCSRALVCIPVRLIQIGEKISLPLLELWNARAIG
ncbi:MAG: signal peptidase I [Oscillospiraceae bacterium]|nr:signal peptidase I [Oscillospiraceae bacterium]